ncbi:MAG: hypothetical protein WA790_06370 [Sulfitobacter sp.]
MRYTEYVGGNILQDAFHLFRRNNLTRSQQAFSRSILGMKPSYYSCMVTRGRQPSRRVLETLRMVTKTIMGTFLGNPHFGQPYAKSLNQAYDELQQLVERVNVEMSFVEVMDQLEAEVDATA